MHPFIKKNYPEFLLSLILIIFIIIEIPFLNRPLYWDEAWSYGSAVDAMLKNGPSLLPGAILDYLYRGHPTFFYFITTVWIKIFGPSMISIHVFFLLITINLILVVYFIGKDLVGKIPGLIAVICLVVIPVFLSQASFMLPEVMLALFSLLTLYYYLKDRIILEILFGTLLVYTKETGLVVIGTIILFDFIKRIYNSESLITFFKRLPGLFLHATPILLVSVFFILQKIKLGWFLYPEHVGMMNLDFNIFWGKFEHITKTVFRLQGRIILTILSLASLIYLLVRKKLLANQRKFVLLSILFMMNYIVFSALNFYTVRYTVTIYPFFVLVFAILICTVFYNRLYIPLFVMSLFCIYSIKMTIDSKGIGDDTLRYIKMINVHKKTVEYCKNTNLNDKEIGTHFLMFFNLKNPFLGYSDKTMKFRSVNILDTEEHEVVIISSIEQSPISKSIQNSDKYILLKRFEEEPAWCEIYQKMGTTEIAAPKN